MKKILLDFLLELDIVMSSDEIIRQHRDLLLKLNIEKDVDLRVVLFETIELLDKDKNRYFRIHGNYISSLIIIGMLYHDDEEKMNEVLDMIQYNELIKSKISHIVPNRKYLTSKDLMIIHENTIMNYLINELGYLEGSWDIENHLTDSGPHRKVRLIKKYCSQINFNYKKYQKNVQKYSSGHKVKCAIPKELYLYIYDLFYSVDDIKEIVRQQYPEYYIDIKK